MSYRSGDTYRRGAAVVWTLLLASLAHAQTQPQQNPAVTLNLITNPTTPSVRITAGQIGDPNRLACTITIQKATTTTPNSGKIICDLENGKIRVYGDTINQINPAVLSHGSGGYGESLVSFTITGPPAGGPGTASTWCAYVSARALDGGLYEKRMAGVF